MQVTIGTFNLNNLFSRYNFQASIASLRAAEPDTSDVAVSYSFNEAGDYVLRTFQGRLVKGKDSRATRAIADRILAMDVDVLAVQEVEDIAVLREFNDACLGRLYDHLVLVEGNDRRLIDVAVMSKLPIGAVTSFQTAEHPDEPGRRIFGRDLLCVEILDARRRSRLFNLYNTHLKSHFVDFRVDPEVGREKANRRRLRQAEVVASLITAHERRGSRFVLAGDMNDPVDSPHLQPMLWVDDHALVDGLANPEETRPPKRESQGPGPQTRAWTYRHNPPGRDTPPTYGLYDQLWLSARLAEGLQSAVIDRRTRHGGDGSDHDPAWVRLAL